MEVHTHLANLERELHILRSPALTEEENRQVTNLISRFYLERLSDKVTEAFDKMGYSEEEYERLLNDENQ